MGEAPATLADELVLGRYRPLAPIGSGSSGSVWLARDEKTGRELALKIVAREGKAGSRAEREVEAAMRLRHPRCLQALDYASDDRHVYIAYEYVDGKTMRQALRESALDDRQAIEICAQILEALDHAHSQGIVHRDVKPANVLLARGPEIDVRLVDFGLAQFAEAETLTALGDVPGTLAYISPERLGGAAATPESDVWSVGVMLWEALARWHPFWTGSMLEMARKIESGAPPLETVRPDLPRPLLEAVAKALSFDAGRRPSAGALAKRLRLLLAPVRKRSRRHTPRFSLTLSYPNPARFAHAALAAAGVYWGATQFPFYPGHAPLYLAALAAAVALFDPRTGSALAYAFLLLPLGNYSLGLALAFVAAATAVIALTWRKPTSSQFPVLGILLAPYGALFLLPLAALRIRGVLQRAALVFAAFAAGCIAAGIDGGALPLTGAKPPAGLGIEGSVNAPAVVGALARSLIGQSALLTEGVLLALVAALLPHAWRFGRWGGVAAGTVLIVFGLLPCPQVSVLPVIAGAWITALALTFIPARVSTVRQAVRPSQSIVAREDERAVG